LIITVLTLICIFGLINFYFSLQILRRVSESNAKMSFFEIRWQVHKQMKKYRTLTRDVGGHIGYAYYGYWLSLVLMLASVLGLFTLLTT
jgi:hypothetical protein